MLEQMPLMSRDFLEKQSETLRFPAPIKELLNDPVHGLEGDTPHHATPSEQKSSMESKYPGPMRQQYKMPQTLAMTFSMSSIRWDLREIKDDPGIILNHNFPPVN